MHNQIWTLELFQLFYNLIWVKFSLPTLDSHLRQYSNVCSAKTMTNVKQTGKHNSKNKSYNAR